MVCLFFGDILLAIYCGITTHGLRYDAISDDYQILMIDNRGSFFIPLTKILALKSGSWGNIENHPSGFHNSVRSESQDSLAFVGGAFHWY
ncbi:hypothetical protein P3S67_017156 [Capsicum chacoense]